MIFYDPFLIKVGQPAQFFLKAFLLKFLACVTLKVQSYIFMEQRFRGTAKKELINLKSNVANVKAAVCFFYILTVCTPRNTMDKGCENLATSIVSTMLQESG